MTVQDRDKMIHLTVRVPVSFRFRIDEIAQRNEVTRSDAVRWVLEHGFKACESIRQIERTSKGA